MGSRPHESGMRGVSPAALLMAVTQEAQQDKTYRRRSDFVGFEPEEGSKEDLVSSLEGRKQELWVQVSLVSEASGDR